MKTFWNQNDDDDDECKDTSNSCAQNRGSWHGVKYFDGARYFSESTDSYIINAVILHAKCGWIPCLPSPLEHSTIHHLPGCWFFFVCTERGLLFRCGCLLRLRACACACVRELGWCFIPAVCPSAWRRNNYNSDSLTRLTRPPSRGYVFKINFV